MKMHCFGCDSSKAHEQEDITIPLSRLTENSVHIAERSLTIKATISVPVDIKMKSTTIYSIRRIRTDFNSTAINIIHIVTQASHRIKRIALAVTTVLRLGPNSLIVTLSERYLTRGGKKREIFYFFDYASSLCS